MLTQKEYTELSSCTTAELVAIHNIYTMSSVMLVVGGQARGRAILGWTDQVLRDRGIELEDGKLLKPASRWVGNPQQHQLTWISER